MSYVTKTLVHQQYCMGLFFVTCSYASCYHNIAYNLVLILKMAPFFIRDLFIIQQSECCIALGLIVFHSIQS